jgi:hypothetical protein
MTREQNYACSAIAKHFRLAKKYITNIAIESFKKMGVLESPRMFLAVMPEFEELRIHTTKNTLNIGAMPFIKMVKKSPLYSDFKEMECAELSDVLCFFSGGKLMCMHRKIDYCGIGGVFVRDGDDKGNNSGFVFEPFEHYLKEKYHIAFTED